MLSNSFPYIAFSLLFFLFSLDGYVFSKNTEAYKSIRFLFVNATVLISIYFIGCRGFVAADWYFYLPYFEKCPTFFDETSKIFEFVKNNEYEKGYCLFSIICKSIFDNYFAFQFICFVIDFFVLHSFFKEYCRKYYFLGWMLFWIFQGFVFEIIILRNAKAIMLFLISIKYAEKRKFLPYFFINLLGVFFHSSAVIYIPLYFFFGLKRHPKIELFLFISGGFIYVLQIPLIKPVLLLFSNFMPGRYGHLVQMYLASDLYSASYGITIGFLERFFTFCILYKFSKRIIKNDNRMKTFWFIFLLYSYSYLFMSDFSILIERIPNLFICSYWILYPKLFGLLKKEFKYIFLILLLLYGSMRTATLLSKNWAYYDNFITGAISSMERKNLYIKTGYGDKK